MLVVYISSTPGNWKVKHRQQRIIDLLSSLKIPYEVRDISQCEDSKIFMTKALQAIGKRATAPQLFYGDEYIGGYDELMDANECERLSDFLRVEVNRTPMEFTTT
ncbi:unnamed protein product [Dicrocoelium dendriticum]|nr:unnamed protein product [Dicrocoelium dendriticum]